jgi:hypothetical protein
MSIPSIGLSDDDLDLIWGAAAIRRELNLDTDAQVYGLIRSGELSTCVMRIGRGKRKRLCASRRALRQRFEITAA